MHPRRGRFIRPLLECRRGRLARLSGSAGHRVRPRRLERRCGDSAQPGAGRAPAAAARRGSIRGLSTCWPTRPRSRVKSGTGCRSAAAALTSAACRREGDTLRFDAGRSSEAPLAIARFALKQAMEEVSGGKPVSLRHVTAALEIFRSRGRRDRRSRPPFGTSRLGRRLKGEAEAWCGSAGRGGLLVCPAGARRGRGARGQLLGVGLDSRFGRRTDRSDGGRRPDADAWRSTAVPDRLR